MQKWLGAFLCGFFRELQALHFFAACVAFRDVVLAFVVTHSLTTELHSPWVPRGIVQAGGGCYGFVDSLNVALR